MPHLTRPTNVASETIDGESIVIDMATGAYYSFQGWSAWTWQALCAGLDTTEVAQIVGSSSDVEAFVDQLSGYGLLVSREGEPATEPPPVPATDVEPLAFERYDDMTDIILLDPVHDVDREAGWPRAAETN